MKLISFILIFFGFLIYSFFNLGKFLDVTQEPSKTELLVCLGGNKDRINKTLELFEKGYLSSNKIILTGYENPKSYNILNSENKDLRLTIIAQEKYKDIDFIHKEKLKSTAEEILFVKNYMIKHNIKDVIFITETPHSRRVDFLFNILLPKENLNIKIVANDYKIWDTKTYYKNKHTLIYSLLECLKIVHNIIFYKIFYNVVFFNDLKNIFNTYKSELTNFLYNSL